MRQSAACWTASKASWTIPAAARSTAAAARSWHTGTPQRDASAVGAFPGRSAGVSGSRRITRERCRRRCSSWRFPRVSISSLSTDPSTTSRRTALWRRRSSGLWRSLPIPAPAIVWIRPPADSCTFITIPSSISSISGLFPEQKVDSFRQG